MNVIRDAEGCSEWTVALMCSWYWPLNISVGWLGGTLNTYIGAGTCWCIEMMISSIRLIIVMSTSQDT